MSRAPELLLALELCPDVRNDDPQKESFSACQPHVDLSPNLQDIETRSKTELFLELAPRSCKDECRNLIKVFKNDFQAWGIGADLSAGF
jgi:hypothetical protein